jgi:predicted PurR-regulated permease PerM
MSETGPEPTPDPTETIAPAGRQRLAWATVHVVLLLVTLLCLWPVASGLAWAGVLAITTWPAYRRLRVACGGRPTLSALVMTLLVVLLVAVPLALAGRMLIRELVPAIRQATVWLEAMPGPPGWLQSVPWLGDLWEMLRTAAMTGHLQTGEWLQSLVVPGTRALGLVARALGQTVLAILTLFFLYRNGEGYEHQIGAITRYWLGERAAAVFGPIRGALQAVFIGVILAAAAQGLVAMLGYVAVGLEAPIVLGTVTAVLAVLPFAAVLVWGTAGVGLIVTGAWVKGVALLLWGTLAVSSVDNVVRASVLSGSARLPYLQSLIALIGGLAVFGPLGLFIGPALLAVWLGLWQEWREAAPPPAPGEGDPA